MAVKVRYGNNDHKHEKATEVSVKDGHLYVSRLITRGEWETIAIYAPEKWVYATVISE